MHRVARKIYTNDNVLKYIQKKYYLVTLVITLKHESLKIRL